MMSLLKNRLLIQLLFLSFTWVVVANGFCQDGGLDADGGDMDGGDMDGDIADNLGGVKIDTDGVFQSKLFVDLSGDLDRQRFNAAQSQLNKDVQTPSQLRKISLNRLEAAYRKSKQSGQPIPPEMTFLAGLTRLTHVFYYPETKDIVLAGPAEGFFRNAQDRIVGMK